MKIAVLGNCQAPRLARLVKALVDADVTHHRYVDIATSLDAEVVATQIAKADIVFSQFQNSPRFGPLRSNVLAGARPRVHKFPNLLLSAFQPDMIHVREGGTSFQGALGLNYHSSIAIAAFMKGYTVEKTQGLFNALVFGRLGFYNLFDREIAQLDAHFLANGVSVKWPSATISLMHTLNHPTDRMLAAVAAALCQSAGIATRDTEELADLVADDLYRGVIWPVYPDVAKRFGFQGSYVFRTHNSHQSYYFHTLTEMIESSFEQYTQWQPQQFDVADVGHVLQLI